MKVEVCVFLALVLLVSAKPDVEKRMDLSNTLRSIISKNFKKELQAAILQAKKVNIILYDIEANNSWCHL